MHITKTLRKSIQSGITVALVASCHAWAESKPERQFMQEVSGVGSDSCASFILALNENRPTGGIRMDNKSYFTEAAAYSQWLLGFVNAINWVNDTTKGTANSSGQKISFSKIPIDINAVALSVKKICEAKPDMPLAVAAMQYVNTFVKK
jgi:hypothetical protein